MPMPTTAMEVMPVTAATAMVDTARGPLMLMPTTAMAAFMAAMAATAMVDTARGLLMPMPTTAMEVMAVTAVDTGTDTARGPLTLTTAMAVMAVTAVDTATAMASKFVQVCNNILIPNCHSKHLKTSSYIGGQEH